MVSSDREFIECNACDRVAELLPQNRDRRCIACGSADVRIVSEAEHDRLYKAGVYFDLDSTGNRAKRKR
jgi:hypothetical protein